MIDEKSILEVEIKIPYSFSTGKVVGRFLQSLKEGKPLMVRCKSCGAPLFPPPDACEKCSGEDFEWMEVPLSGEAVIVVNLPDESENLIFVKLDDLPYPVPLKGVKNIKKGDRVKMVIRENPRGHITDLLVKREGET